MEGRHLEQGGPQGQEPGSEQLQRWCRRGVGWGGRPGARDTRESPGRRAGRTRSLHGWPGLRKSGREQGDRATWDTPQLAPFTDLVGFQ